MKQTRKEFHIGPGAASLLLIVVVLSLSALSMLMLTSARNDNSLAQRSAGVTQIVYQLQDAAETHLAALDAVLLRCAAESVDASEYFGMVAQNLPAEMQMEEDRVFWTEYADGRRLECAVRIAFPGEAVRFERTQWRVVSEVGEEEDLFEF